jgi:hypothetical protein
MNDLPVIFPKPCSEKWDEMAQDGCNRFCARCTTTIHDLANYTFEEAEALLSSPEPVCVRAQIGADRAIVLQPGRSGKLRRMVVVATASVGLMAMSSAAIATKRGPEGMIAGIIYEMDERTAVAAIGADGARHEVKTDRSGRFRIKHLAPGTYQLEFTNANSTWSGETVVVHDERITYTNTSNPDVEYIVGTFSRAPERPFGRAIKGD